MRIITVQVETHEDTAAMLSIRRAVFDDEMRIKLDPLQS